MFHKGKKKGGVGWQRILFLEVVKEVGRQGEVESGEAGREREVVEF